MLEREVKTQPHRVRWAGFEATTCDLYDQGWELIVEELKYECVFRLLLKHKGVVAVTGWKDKWELQQKQLIFNIYAINGDIRETRIASPNGTYFETDGRVPARPVEYREYSIKSIFNIKEEILVAKANESVLSHLQAIKDLQLKESKERETNKRIVLAKVIGV